MESSTVNIHATSDARRWPGLSPEDYQAIAADYEILDDMPRKGGMGVVLHARRHEINLEVALKLKLPAASEQRFLREAKALAQIKSPFVVSVTNFKRLPSGNLMIVMEWVEGSNLLQKLQASMKDRGGPVPEDTAMHWIRHVCQGMVEAAKHGIIHRDLKPHNILIDERPMVSHVGQAKVADLGLARLPSHSDESSPSNQVVGTPAYMAPEQWTAPKKADTRADIYSFGVTFYFVLTGELPFEGDGEGAGPFYFYEKHKNETPIPPCARNSSISPQTNDILLRCLAKSPDDRFQSFEDILRLVRTRRTDQGK